jgi:PTH2 family peptidyl-tRNA hydrolase
MDHYETKQVIVMRTKYPDGKGGTFKIRTGKMIAQACHASISFLTNRLDKNYEINSSFSEAQKHWLDNDFAKICLQVETEEELLDIAAKANEAGVECHIIVDNGTTEFHGVPTRTCLALGPDTPEKINSITGHLKLL